MACTAQYENELRASKVNAAMLERARQGYWVTQPPLGFKIKNVMPDGTLADSVGRKERVKLPKVLMPDDTIIPSSGISVAEAVTTVLLRFARGDISLYSVHRLALELGLTGGNGKPLPFNSLRNMLEHPAYAGYSKPGRLLSESVRLRFDGLISKDDYDRIQVRLRTNKPLARTKDNNWYPLDGTILCERCGMPLHGDAPRDGSSNHCPRYYCRGGAKRGHRYESAKAIDIHTLFDEFLQQVTPTDGMIRLFKEVLKRTARARLGDVNRELKAIAAKESELNIKKQRAIDALLEGRLSQEEKDGYMNDLEAQRFHLKQRRVELEGQQNLNETTIEYVCNLMDKPAKLWRDANLESKRAFQKMLFPNGLHINLKSKKCRTEDLGPLFSVIATKNEPEGSENSEMVISAGVEPALTG